MKIFITGRPGSGKSRLVQEIVRELGVKAGGISTPEMRKDGRLGFKIIDVASGKEGILASVDIKGPPRVSKYGVSLKDIEDVGVAAIKAALEDPEIKLLVVDELGAMELKSEQFQKVVQEALDSKKDLLVVLHRTLVGKYKQYGKVFALTAENREDVKRQVLEMLRK